VATVSSCRCHDYATSIKLSSMLHVPIFFSYCVPLYSWPYRTISRELKRRHHVFELDPIALVSIHVTRYPPEFINILITPLRVRQSKPPKVDRGVVRNWPGTMQASGISSRLCCTSFFDSSLSILRRVTKKNGHARLNFATFSKTIVQITQNFHPIKAQ